MTATKAFFSSLQHFLASLHKRFPGNKGVADAVAKIGVAPTLYPGVELTVAKRWLEVVSKIAQNIKDRDGAVVAEAFDKSGVMILSELDAGTILNDPEVEAETIEAVWMYIDQITELAHLAVKEEAAVTTEPMHRPPPVSAAIEGAASKGPDVEKIVESITSAMPKVIQGLNKALKTEGNDNPVGDLIKQLMNPNQVQPGLAPNLLSMAMDRGDSSLMEASAPSVAAVAQNTGMSESEILAKLDRLEKYERMRQRRRGGGK